MKFKTLYLHDGDYMILKVPEKSFFSYIRENNGVNTVICRGEFLEKAIEFEDGWKIIELKGPLPFEEAGLLARLTLILSQAEISVLVQSTFDNDCIFLKVDKLQKAIKALEGNGYYIDRECK